MRFRSNVVSSTPPWRRYPRRLANSSAVLNEVYHAHDCPIDDSTTPELRREVFKSMPVGDKYELVFDGGHHFTFSDSDGLRARRRDPDHHPAIQQISLKFWQAYLKNDLPAKAWLQSAQPRKDCKLKSADVWQWK